MKFFFGKAHKTRKAVTAGLICGAFALSGAGIFLAAAEESPADIVAPETGFNAVAHYEFRDETNLGKDTLGNYDLVAKNV